MIELTLHFAIRSTLLSGGFPLRGGGMLWAQQGILAFFIEECSEERAVYSQRTVLKKTATAVILYNSDVQLYKFTPRQHLIDVVYIMYFELKQTRI